MIGIISPAMNMRIEERPEISLSEPHMMEKAERIYEELKRLQPWEIQNLMKVNDKIALQAFWIFRTGKKETAQERSLLMMDWSLKISMPGI